jgi:ABC-type transport system substrate-binding protein
MIGTRLADRYEIIGELGRGGMGVVYRARDPLLNREIAVKLIPPTMLSPDSEHRFQREAQLVAQMDHPAIVSIYDFGRHEGSLYFLMPLVQGTNLRAFLRQDSSLGDVLEIGIQVAEALEYSHARGVVHRDIKPENVMVSREEGGGVRVRVMDFGLARGSTESRLTKTGTLVGTLSYLSPEQVAAREVDGRSDVYALGTLLYECLVGQAPFSGGETQSILYRIVHEFAQSPRALGAAIDEELEAIVLQCLAKEPGQRPQRAGELAESLRRYRLKLHDSDRARSVAGFTRTFMAQRPALAPFIGRTKEFAELQQRLNAAIAGECQFEVVAGEPGVGKTRLLEELEKLARARSIRVLHGRSAEQDRAFPYQGFCDLIQEYFKSKETGSSPAPDFSDLAADLVALFPMLSEIGEIRAAATGDSKLTRGGSAPENKTQVFELLARTLTRIAGGRPLVIFVEDLHEAEVSIEALQYIVQRLSPTATLIVGSYRSTEVDGRHPLSRMLSSFRGDRRFQQIQLEPLSASDHRLFLETLVGTGISDSLVKRLYEGTEGNPYFTKELVRSLMESGAIARDDSGAWSLSAEAGFSADVLPATIQAAVEKRIERLPDDLRLILSMASVIGKAFDSRDLEALGEGKDIDDAIDRLAQEGLIEEEREARGDRLAFSSGVVRDVLYAALPPRKRRSLHRRYAELLETRHGGRLERALPQLVHHFCLGDVPEKTVEYGLRLAKASLEAFSAEEAARAAKASLQFLDDEWEGDAALEGEARTLLARAYRMAGDIDGALREAAAAVRIFEQQKQPARSLPPMLLAAETAWQARRSEEASRWLERGLAVARAVGDTDSLRQLLSLAATLANLRGEYEKANEHLEEVASLLRGTKEAEAEREIPSGGRLVVALANPVEAASPIAIQTIEEEETLGSVFETLLASDAQGHVVPALCASWEAGEAGRSFLLRLRDDVRFQDGQPLAAADVKASIEAQIGDAPRELPAAFGAIQGVQDFIEKRTAGVGGIVVRAAHELEIRLAEALPIYPALLSHQRTAIVRVVPGDAGGRPRLVGTGPFGMVSHAPGRIVLERNRDYWRAGLPRLDAVEFRPSLTAAAIAKGFRSGEIDLARDLLPGDLEEILRDARFRRGLVETAKRNTYMVLFNVRSGPAAQAPALRQALCGVVRPRDLVWRTLGRFAEPAVGLIPPGMLGHDPGRRSRVLALDEARETLDAAGVSLPIRLKAAVHPLLQDRYGSLLAALFSIWSELGVEVSVETHGMAEFLESELRTEGLDLRVGRWNADYDDPDNFTHALFHSQTGRWRSWFSSADADAILEEARSESRSAVRENLYRKFESLALELDALVPLFHDIDYRLASPQVQGLRLRGTAPWVNYGEVGKGEPAEPAAEARSVGGGIVHVPIAGVVSTLDPTQLDTMEMAETVPNIVETLTRDAGAARIVPWLAAEFRVEDGGRSYRFRLRDDVRFHDGRRLTARDVRYSFERLLQRPGDPRWIYASIRGAQALLEGKATDLSGLRIHSATEFTIDLEEPVAFFPALIAFQAASIIPEGSEPGSETCVGTGPFRLVAFEPGRRLELARNKAYWRKGYPRSEGLVYSFGVTPKDMLAGFRDGRFSLASDLLPADVETLRREPAFASGYRETPRLSTYYLACNTHRGPLTDRGLRQRLIRAVDAHRLVRQTVGRLAVRAVSLIPPGLLGHESLPGLSADMAPSPPPEAPAAAIELTAAAHPVYFEGYSALARELWSALAQAGFKVRCPKLTIDEALKVQRQASVDLVLARWNADYPDADNFAYRLHSQGGNLGRLCGSPEIDRLIESGRTETTAAIRHSIYRRIEEIIAREGLLVPLFHEQAYRFARPEVEGLSIVFGSPTVVYEELRIRE